MTGTTVKNTGAGAILTNLVSNTGKSAKNEAVSAGFQTVWNSQMGKNARSAAAETPKAEKPERNEPAGDGIKQGEALQAGANQGMRTDGRQPVDNETDLQPEAEELSPEELERAMEVLGTAAAELMQKIAAAFGITAEELQGEMEQLGLEALDLLEAPKLGGLILKLGGAEDVSALLTDEALCGSFRNLMEQLNLGLEEAAGKLEMEPEQLKTLLSEQLAEQTVPVEADREETTDGDVYGKLETAKAPRDGEAVLRNEPAEEVSAEEATVRKTEAGEQKSEGRQSGKETDGGPRGEMFAQELRNAQPEAGLQQTQEAAGSSPWNADAQDIMRQIMDYMRIQLNSDTTNLEMQLHPESLGTLRVQVESKAGVLTANFVAQNEAVKAALESQMVQLQERFEEQGVKVEAIEVTVQSHAFERNLDQGRGESRGSGEPSRRARVRRINLNDPLSMENMEQEDVLAADMLAAGGSTVDYTA